MKFTEETVKAAAFTLSAFCSSQECGTCPFGGKDGNTEIPCLFKSAEPATWFPMALEMNANHRIRIPDHSNRSKDAERGEKA